MARAICAERQAGPGQRHDQSWLPGSGRCQPSGRVAPATIRGARLPVRQYLVGSSESSARRRYHPWRIDLPIQFRAERLHLQAGTAPTCNSVSAECLVKRVQPLGELGRIQQEFLDFQRLDVGG